VFSQNIVAKKPIVNKNYRNNIFLMTGSLVPEESPDILEDFVEEIDEWVEEQSARTELFYTKQGDVGVLYAQQEGLYGDKSRKILAGDISGSLVSPDDLPGVFYNLRQQSNLDQLPENSELPEDLDLPEVEDGIDDLLSGAGEIEPESGPIQEYVQNTEYRGEEIDTYGPSFAS